MPKLEGLYPNNNPLGSRGVTSLVLALRKLPALKHLTLTDCEIDDEGVSSLFANLGKDDFKKLEDLDLRHNKITQKGWPSKLIAALDDTGGMPKLTSCFILHDPAHRSEVQRVHDALAQYLAKRSECLELASSALGKASSAMGLPPDRLPSSSLQ